MAPVALPLGPFTFFHFLSCLERSSSLAPPLAHRIIPATCNRRASLILPPQQRIADNNYWSFQRSMGSQKIFLTGAVRLSYNPAYICSVQRLITEPVGFPYLLQIDYFRTCRSFSAPAVPPSATAKILPPTNPLTRFGDHLFSFFGIGDKFRGWQVLHYS